MGLFEQMTTIKDRVGVMLKSWPHLRNDDYKLIASYWKFETDKKGVDLDKITATEFLQMFADGKLTHSESIRRVRAKLQERNPSLRGDNYGKRQTEGDQVRQNIDEL